MDGRAQKTGSHGDSRILLKVSFLLRTSFLVLKPSFWTRKNALFPERGRATAGECQGWRTQGCKNDSTGVCE